jgi:hypothetical protein
MPPHDALGSFFQPSDQPEMASLRKKERAVPFATPRPTGGFVFSIGHQVRFFLASLRKKERAVPLQPPANWWVRFFNRPSSPLFRFVAQLQWSA